MFLPGVLHYQAILYFSSGETQLEIPLLACLVKPHHLLEAVRNVIVISSRVLVTKLQLHWRQTLVLSKYLPCSKTVGCSCRTGLGRLLPSIQCSI